MAHKDQLTWTTLAEVTDGARAFLDPVLAGHVDARWHPETWAWGAL
jgi:hypothetical protein